MHRAIYTFVSLQNYNILHDGKAAMANLACVLQVDEHLPRPLL
jgi:hypothetical protein